MKHLLLESIPFVGMVMVECLDVGMTTISKAAMSKGMSHFVFVVYSNALASLILLPSSLFLTRFISLSQLFISPHLYCHVDFLLFFIAENTGPPFLSLFFANSSSLVLLGM